MASHLGWFGLAQGWHFVLLFVSAVVLARLISPDEYAVMAFILPVVGLAQQVQSLGFSSAIIQAREVSRTQLDALFWLAFAVASLLALVVTLAGPPFARWLMGIEVDREMAVASLALVLAALAGQPNALLTRSLRFKAIALRNMVAVACSTFVGIAIAAVWHSHWALIANLVMFPLAQFLGALFLVRWRPGLPKRAPGLRPMLDFGLKVWLTNLLIYFSHNADNLIVAGATNPHQLAIYDRSYRGLVYPLNQAVGPLGQVLVPNLTRAVDQPEVYRGFYWRATTMLLVACLPVLAVVAIYPVTVFGALLGPTWIEGAPLFGWFALAAMVEIFTTSLNWHPVSQGRGGDALRSGLATAMIGLGSVIVGISWGILGVAVAYLLGRVLLCLPLVIWLTGRSGLVRHRELLSGVAPHALALSAVLFALAIGRSRLGEIGWPLLIANGVGAYGLYLAIVCVFAPSRELVWGLAQRGLSLLRRG